MIFIRFLKLYLIILLYKKYEDNQEQINSFKKSKKELDFLIENSFSSNNSNKLKFNILFNYELLEN